MKKIRQYLDDAADRGLVKNDSDLATRLGITRQSVSAWRNGDATPDADQAAALAALLNRPEILAECMAARAKKPENRAMWERAARALSMPGACLSVVGVVLFTTPGGVKAAPLLEAVRAALCVMSTSLRNGLARLRATAPRLSDNADGEAWRTVHAA